MSRYCAYIDGFNVYYALQEKPYRKYKWLNYRKLAESVIGENDRIVEYFTLLQLFIGNRTIRFAIKII